MFKRKDGEVREKNCVYRVPSGDITGNFMDENVIFKIIYNTTQIPGIISDPGVFFL
ncbi:hypothetical protein KQI22_04395 [Kineothrix sp. MSJ-39]|uniref:hypothetical protein n=1 Tax=Kineothrix sp. MSJ-39 TaxID=2841533 RepID=UPI001C10A151|nr:hypothetical protein [Kineothrix sp. MSJ-39]MBU5429311.1 hypothetical protein [Kineothrix sp. MSJ-39]